jgi:hypothetical protein
MNKSNCQLDLRLSDTVSVDVLCSADIAFKDTNPFEQRDGYMFLSACSSSTWFDKKSMTPEMASDLCQIEAILLVHRTVSTHQDELRHMSNYCHTDGAVSYVHYPHWQIRNPKNWWNVEESWVGIGESEKIPRSQPDTEVGHRIVLLEYSSINL